MKETNAIELLNILGNILQIFSYQENITQTSNDEIMKELEHQNKEYLEQIIERLERIENARKS